MTKYKIYSEHMLNAKLYSIQSYSILLRMWSDLSKYMHTTVAHIFWLSTNSIFSCGLLHAFQIWKNYLLMKLRIICSIRIF